MIQIPLQCVIFFPYHQEILGTPARCPTVPHNLPGSSVRSHRLHAQSTRLLPTPTSDTNGKFRVSLVLLTDLA